VAQCQERQTLLAKENERLREAMVVMVEGAKIGTYGDNFKKTPRVQRWRAGSFEMCVFCLELFLMVDKQAWRLDSNIFCNDIDIEGGKFYNNKINHRFLNVLNVMKFQYFV